MTKEKTMRKLRDVQDKIDDNSVYIPYNGCKIWLGSTSRGYGYVRDAGKIRSTHRVAYETAHGAIPPLMHVLHKCDVKCCVNPGHLFLGTNKDNMHDRDEKGRQARGEKQGNHILTRVDAGNVRDSVGTEKEVAIQYGVSRSTVGAIRRNNRWRHIS